MNAKNLNAAQNKPKAIAEDKQLSSLLGSVDYMKIIAVQYRQGEVSEWLKVRISKVCVQQCTVGSNPTLSDFLSSLIEPTVPAVG